MRSILLYKIFLFTLFTLQILHLPSLTGSVNCETVDENETSNELCIKHGVIERAHRIESVRKELLEKLGLDNPPNITAPMLSNNAMEEINENDETNPDTPFYAMPINTYKANIVTGIYGITPIRNNQYLFSTNYITFKMTLQAENYHIHTAKLKFNLEPDNRSRPTPQNASQMVLLYVEKNNRRKLIAEKRISVKTRKLECNITKLLKDMIAKRNQSQLIDIKLRLSVVVVENGKRITRRVTKTPDNARPLIKIKSIDVKDAERSRSRRSNSISESYCSANPNEKKCCVKPLTINFKEDLDWQYIAEPKTFQANYCAGECPITWHNENAQFYIILDAYRKKRGGHFGPCCVPYDFDPLTIIYFTNEGEKKTKEIPNLRVKSCICR